MATFDMSANWLQRRHRSSWLTKIHLRGLSTGTPPSTVFPARQAQLTWTSRATLVAGAVVASLLLPIVIWGQVFLPGLLLLWFLYNEVRPLRLVAFGYGTVNLVGVNALTSSPNDLLETVGAETVDHSQSSTIRVGDYLLSMRDRDFRQFVDVLATAPEPTHKPPVPPPVSVSSVVEAVELRKMPPAA